eukprot:274302-Hanusia_phi.AAC.3
MLVRITDPPGGRPAPGHCDSHGDPKPESAGGRVPGARRTGSFSDSGSRGSDSRAGHGLGTPSSSKRRFDVRAFITRRIGCPSPPGPGPLSESLTRARHPHQQRYQSLEAQRTTKGWGGGVKNWNIYEGRNGRSDDQEDEEEGGREKGREGGRERKRRTRVDQEKRCIGKRKVSGEWFSLHGLLHDAFHHRDEACNHEALLIVLTCEGSVKHKYAEEGEMFTSGKASDDRNKVFQNDHTHGDSKISERNASCLSYALSQGPYGDLPDTSVENSETRMRLAGVRGVGCALVILCAAEILKDDSIIDIAFHRLYDTALDISLHLSREASSIAHKDASQGVRKPKVVIAGSGWGAHALLKIIDTNVLDVVCVSPRSYFIFTPMLASASVGTGARMVYTGER